MLSRSLRLPRSLVAQPQGRRVRFTHGSFVMVAGKPAGAVVAPKKIFKTAPARNKARRRIAHIIRTLIRRGILTRGIIVYPAASVLTAPFAQIAEMLETAISTRGHS